MEQFDCRGQKMSKGQTKRIFCNNCRTITNHECVGEHIKKEEYKVDDEGPEHVEMDVMVHRLWICAGCEYGVME